LINLLVAHYEAALWRQVAQTLFALDALDRRKTTRARGTFWASATGKNLRPMGALNKIFNPQRILIKSAQSLSPPYTTGI
jgi:hypothetical protein